MNKTKDTYISSRIRWVQEFIEEILEENYSIADVKASLYIELKLLKQIKEEQEGE